VRQARNKRVGVLGFATLLFGVACASVLAGAGGQAPPPERPQLAEEVFKNVQILKGIPVKEFMGTMGMFAASTGMNCTDCHVEESGGDWGRYADDTDLKRTARRMMTMVNSVNQSMFGGRRMVSCYSCHRGANRPRVIPDLSVQYGDAIIIEPDEILTAQAVGQPTADQILDKYIAAIGGAQRLAGITSVVARGMYQGFDDYQKYPVEVYASAPGQRVTIMHGAFGDTTWTFDGRTGWVGAPKVSTPVPVLPLTGGDLEGAKVEAALAFPARIKQMLVEWRVGDPAIVGDRELQVVQGKVAPGSLPTKLYFDPATGLLERLVYFNETPVGRIPTQIDYSDYRDVSGVKLPFKWTTTWTDGRAIFEIDSVQVNVPVDARRFARPAPPA
jgi:photosynthetic reaction center cytochrome c subunit